MSKFNVTYYATLDILPERKNGYDSIKPMRLESREYHYPHCQRQPAVSYSLLCNDSYTKPFSIHTGTSNQVEPPQHTKTLNRTQIIQNASQSASSNEQDIHNAKMT